MVVKVLIYFNRAEYSHRSGIRTCHIIVKVDGELKLVKFNDWTILFTLKMREIILSGH